ncbi:MAG: hypothetical protein H6649_03685 [Caldilineae bacterium]|nr:hypothetical protein [Caldilineae bacterium]
MCCFVTVLLSSACAIIVCSVADAIQRAINSFLLAAPVHLPPGPRWHTCWRLICNGVCGFGWAVIVGLGFLADIATYFRRGGYGKLATASADNDTGTSSASLPVAGNTWDARHWP